MPSKPKDSHVRCIECGTPCVYGALRCKACNLKMRRGHRNYAVVMTPAFAARLEMLHERALEGKPLFQKGDRLRSGSGTAIRANQPMRYIGPHTR